MGGVPGEIISAPVFALLQLARVSLTSFMSKEMSKEMTLAGAFRELARVSGSRVFYVMYIFLILFFFFFGMYIFYFWLACLVCQVYFSFLQPLFLLSST